MFFDYFIEEFVVSWIIFSLRNIVIFGSIPFILLFFTPFFWIPLTYYIYVIFTWNERDFGRGR